jgi:hypothetical protein
MQMIKGDSNEKSSLKTTGLDHTLTFTDSLFGGEGGPSLLNSDVSGEPSILSPATSPSVSPVPKAPTGGSFRNDAFNPSPSSSDVTNADLTGLTPAMVNQAFQLKLLSDQIKQKNIMDVSAVALREAQTTKALRPEKETAAVETFKYAKSLEGGSFTGDMEAWKNAAQTAHQKNWIEAKKKSGYTGSFWEYVKEVTRLGATTIVDARKKGEQATQLKGEAQVRSPDFSQSVTEDLMKNMQAWSWPTGTDKRIAAGATAEDALVTTRKVMVITEMEARVKTAFTGQKVVRKKDGWYIDNKLVVRNPYAN